MKSEISNYYGSDLEAMAAANNYNKWIQEEFFSYLEGHVVEVGAGGGNFSKYLLQDSVKKLDLFEPSQNMYPLLVDTFISENKVTTHNCYFTGMDVKLDTVVYCNVMEHIDDDVGEMKTVFDSLKPGGHLLIFVPALKLLFSKADHEVGHCRRYHKQDLINRLHHAGFEVVKAKYFDLVGSFLWYTFFVLLRGTYSRKSVSLYDKIGVPVTKTIESFWPPPFGKNLVVVAKHP